MQMCFVIAREEEFILQKFSGALTYEKWVKSADTIWQHPDYNKFYRSIVDFRKADVQMGVTEIKAIVKHLSDNEDKALRADTVILVNEPMAAAFASIFADSIKQLIDTKIMTTEEGAAAKLNLNASVFELLNGPAAVQVFID